VANQTKVSIIIRCKNEEDWIGHCLKGVYGQSHDNFEVILVDSGSTDKTLDIVSSFPVDYVVKLEHYLPGYAINEGVKVSQGEIIVILSSHCVPKDNEWLRNLVAGFVEENVVGIYGRQLPVSFSTPHDIRDLFITFGLDRRVQIKDCFFHNANSAIRRSIWNEFPFDDTATNIEDRIWGKKVTESGYHLVYEPTAEVFHYHGIHQGQNTSRARSTLQVLKDVENFDHQLHLPESLMPSNRDIVAIIPLKDNHETINGFDPLQNLLDELKDVKHLKAIYLIASPEIIKNYNLDKKFIVLERPVELNSSEVSLGTVLKWGLDNINNANRFPDYVLYVNPEYVFRPENLMTKLIEDACYKGLDSVFVGYAEYSTYWSYDDESEDYRPFGEDLMPRTSKHALYKSLFGLGCITRSRIISEEEIVGDTNIGIIATNDLRHTLRITDPSMFNMISTLFGQEN